MKFQKIIRIIRNTHPGPMKSAVCAIHRHLRLNLRLFSDIMVGTSSGKTGNSWSLGGDHSGGIGNERRCAPCRAAGSAIRRCARGSNCAFLHQADSHEAARDADRGSRRSGGLRPTGPVAVECLIERAVGLHQPTPDSGERSTSRHRHICGRRALVTTQAALTNFRQRKVINDEGT